jgi:hypothetical protein
MAVRARGDQRNLDDGERMERHHSSERRTLVAVTTTQQRLGNPGNGTAWRLPGCQRQLNDML